MSDGIGRCIAVIGRPYRGPPNAVCSRERWLIWGCDARSATRGSRTRRKGRLLLSGGARETPQAIGAFDGCDGVAGQQTLGFERKGRSAHEREGDTGVAAALETKSTLGADRKSCFKVARPEPGRCVRIHAYLYRKMTKGWLWRRRSKP
jgi:hypothetical protein